MTLSIFILSWLIVGIIFATITVKWMNPREYSHKMLPLYALCGYVAFVVFILACVWYVSFWVIKGEKP